MLAGKHVIADFDQLGPGGPKVGPRGLVGVIEKNGAKGWIFLGKGPLGQFNESRRDCLGQA